MIVAGIDWSLSSPAITIYDDVLYTHAMYSFAKTKKQNGLMCKNVILFEQIQYDSNEERFDKLTNWAYELCTSNKVEIVFIEEYAFAANGRITDLAECVGVLKHKFYQSGVMVVPVVPSAVKKYATGNGAAKKDQMANSYEEDEDNDLFEMFNVSRTVKTIPSPMQDLVDSYWVARYGLTKIADE